MSTTTPTSCQIVEKSLSFSADAVLAKYQDVRAMTLKLVEPLSAEDCALQAMPDASPAKWHLAHSTWFFESLVLGPNVAEYKPVNETYLFLFNSYYNSLGKQYSRPHRGLLTRPSLDEVLDYRRAIDDRMLSFLSTAEEKLLARIAPIVIVGLNHEQQHQELILTDIKALFWANPLRPAYHGSNECERSASDSPDRRWVNFPEGRREIGFAGDGFSYDNETPRHRVWLDGFSMATCPVTNSEYARFIADGGYERSEFWLSDGWNAVLQHGWRSPPYWEQCDGRWTQFTLAGMRDLHPSEPVCHLSYFEADAFARWAEARLPTEAEWEVAASEGGVDSPGMLVEDEQFHPAPVAATTQGTAGLQRMIGDIWEWTSSAYSAYPGYQVPSGALGEYNAKFMCNQFVLRGGSCATSRSHIRVAYRNYFAADARWQFSGLRLARNQ